VFESSCPLRFFLLSVLNK
jgi:hypothetical protein